MKINYEKQAREEYQKKLAIKKKMAAYYRLQANKNGLKALTRIASYLPEKYKPLHISRGIAFSHLDLEPIIDLIARGEEFSVVSGLNSSSPLHLGHKTLFDFLLALQRLGGRIFIPITNDESYVDGKVKSLKESKKIAYQEIIPSLVALGFDPGKTHIFVDSDYSDIYHFAIHLSRYLNFSEVEAAFGVRALRNPGQIFYRGVVQMAQILLPQLPEFSGPKSVLIPVGLDQHPYILLARDVAKRMKLIPPSEIVIKLLPSLKEPEKKMSGSKLKSAIYLSDNKQAIEEKIQQAYTGSVSVLKVHQELGGIPEICSVFSLLYYQHPNDDLINDLYQRYCQGKVSSRQLKEIAIDYVVQMIDEHQAKKKKVTQKEIDKFILQKPLKSFLGVKKMLK